MRPAQTTAPAPTSNQSTTVRNSRLGCFFFLSLSPVRHAPRAPRRGADGEMVAGHDGSMATAAREIRRRERPVIVSVRV